MGPFYISSVFLAYLVLSTSTFGLSLSSEPKIDSDSWKQWHSSSWRSSLLSTQRKLLSDRQSGTVKPPNGVRAELFHRDHELRSPTHLSRKERTERDVKFSKMRAEDLTSRGELRIPNGAKRRLAENFKAKVVTAPGEYVMSISVGTPPQNFVAVIDTGSDLTWLQCTPCEQCFTQVNGPFLPRNSSTLSQLSCASDACNLFLEEYNEDWVTSCSVNNPNEVGCEYAYFYADSSNTTGDFVSDTLNLQLLDGNITRVPNFSFGCSRRSYSPSSLLEGSDGLVGLAQGGISFPAQIGSQYGDVFSYCLVSDSNSRSKSSTMYFGAEAAVFNISGLQYTPLLSNPSNPTFYYVGLEGLSVDGQQVDISENWFSFDKGKGGVFLDSGTTLTIMEPRALDALAKVLILRMNYTLVSPSPLDGFDYCWNVRGEFEKDVRGPKISFNFTGVNYELEFENAYIFVSTRSYRIVCLAMAPASDTGGATIIGNIVQRNFHVVYDRIEKRIGFAKKDCSSTQTLTSHIFLILVVQTLSLAAMHFVR